MLFILTKTLPYLHKWRRYCYIKLYRKSYKTLIILAIWYHNLERISIDIISHTCCLDPTAYDYDCIGGSGDGPRYTGLVHVLGDDHFDLDRDGDGIACDI